MGSLSIPVYAAEITDEIVETEDISCEDTIEVEEDETEFEVSEIESDESEAVEEEIVEEETELEILDDEQAEITEEPEIIEEPEIAEETEIEVEDENLELQTADDEVVYTVRYKETAFNYVHLCEVKYGVFGNPLEPIADSKTTDAEGYTVESYNLKKGKEHAIDTEPANREAACVDEISLKNSDSQDSEVIARYEENAIFTTNTGSSGGILSVTTFAPVKITVNFPTDGIFADDMILECASGVLGRYNIQMPELSYSSGADNVSSKVFLVKKNTSFGVYLYTKARKQVKSCKYKIGNGEEKSLSKGAYSNYIAKSGEEDGVINVTTCESVTVWFLPERFSGDYPSAGNSNYSILNQDYEITSCKYTINGQAASESPTNLSITGIDDTATDFTVVLKPLSSDTKLLKAYYGEGTKRKEFSAAADGSVTVTFSSPKILDPFYTDSYSSYYKVNIVETPTTTILYPQVNYIKLSKDANGKYRYEAERGKSYIINAVQKGNAYVALSAVQIKPYGSDDFSDLNLNNNYNGNYATYTPTDSDVGKDILIRMTVDPTKSEWTEMTMSVIAPPTITKASVKETVLVNKVPTIKQEVGISNKEYTLVLDSKELVSPDVLKIDNTNAQNFTAAIDQANKKIKITTDKVNPVLITGSFDIVNESTNTKLTTVNVTSFGSSWTGIAPTASLTMATDIDFTLNLTPPKGLDVSDGTYWYAVSISDKKKPVLPGDRRVAEGTYYFKAVGNTVSQLIASVLQENTSEDPANPNWCDKTNLGEGFAAGINVKVALVQTANKVNTSDAVEAQIYQQTLPAKAAKVAVTTKNPYHADKITLKKVKTTVLCGEQGVKVAMVDFGKNASFITTDCWSVISVDGPDELDVYQSTTNPYDSGIYVNANAEYGKYTITAANEDESSKASIVVTISPSIERIDLSATTNVYKVKGKAASFKFKASAFDRDFKKIKSPKIRYEVGSASLNSDGTVKNITKQPWLTVKSGVVTVDKTYNPTSTTRGYTFAVMAYADDYAGNTTKSALKFTITDLGTDIGSLEVYTAEPGNPPTNIQKIAVKTGEICFEDVWYQDTYFVVRNKKGEAVFGTPENPIPYIRFGQQPSESAGGSNAPLYSISDNLNRSKYPTKAGNITYTVTGVDGKKASFKCKYGYSRYNDRIKAIAITENTEVDPYVCINWGEDDPYKDPFEYCVSPEFKPGDPLYITIAETEGGFSSLNTPMVDKTLAVSGGAKIIEDCGTFNKKQCLKIAFTGDKATIKLMQNGKVIHTVNLVNPWFASKIAAPASSSIKVNNDKKVYSGYKYPENSGIEIILKKPITLEEGIDPESVIKVAFVQTLGDDAVVLSNPVYETYMDGKTKKAKITAGWPEGKHDSKKYTFRVFYYVDKVMDDEEHTPYKYYLTKAPSTINISTTAYKKAFSLNASAKMEYDATNGAKPIELAYKGTNVASVDFDPVTIKFNNKGTYSDFNKIFTFTEEDGKKKLSILKGEGQTAEAVLASEAAGKANKFLPKARTGYVKCTVTYLDGTTKTVNCKITVNFKASKKRAKSN